MRYLLSLLLIIGTYVSFAHNDTLSSAAPANSSHTRISILTCGTGQELYSSFGHTGVRVIDSITGKDEVYNYGTFNFNDPEFYSKFTLGKLLYYVEKSSFNNFMYTYIEEKRNVQEQVLQLDEAHTKAFVAYLENNIKPEHKDYKYDFLFDNCATRVRDIFPKVLGQEFYFGDILNNKKISYRGIINQYLVNKHWERFGINLLLGSRIDSLMTDEGTMFLPDFVHKGLVHAKFQGNHVVKEELTLLKHPTVMTRKLNGPLWMMIGILVLTILSFHIKAFRYLKPVIKFAVLFITGLLGVFMLFMWLGTNHQSCADNYNILWAVPFNLVIAFLAHKKKFWLRIYALAAISLLIVAMAVHVIGFQQLPLIELSPLMLCLMYIYIDMYKQNVNVPVPGATAQQQIKDPA
jgi:hypothetical protein